MNNILKHISFDACRTACETIRSHQYSVFFNYGKFHVVKLDNTYKSDLEEVYEGIKYFKSKENLTTSDLIELGDFCRSIIVTRSNWTKTTEFVNPNNVIILNPFGKGAAIRYVSYDFNPVFDNYIETETSKILRDDYLKLSTVYHYPYEWKEFIALIREKYPDNIFHSFTFEDSLFLLYSEQKLYFGFEFIKKLIYYYDKDVLFYIECLGGAIKTFMKTLNIEPKKKDQTRKYKRLSEQIFYEFIECYLEIQEKNDKQYFIQVKSNSKKPKVD